MARLAAPCHGQGAAADRTYRPLRYGQRDAAFERDDATVLAEEATGRTLTPSEASTYWRGQALDYITTQPGDWVALMLRKFVLLWNATEAVDAESQYSHAEWSLPLRVTGWFTHFGVLVPLALLGVWASWSQRRRLSVLYLMFATYRQALDLWPNDFATRAAELTKRQQVQPLDALAAAYAAAGRFDRAVAMALAAIGRAEALGQTELVTEIGQRLRLYRQNRPYRQTL